MYKKFILILISFVLFVPIIAKADCTDCDAGSCVNGECRYNNFVVEKEYAKCGDGLLTNIPPTIPKLTNLVYKVLQVVVPVLLVLFSSLDLIKAVIASKEDEIKKNQGIVIKRLIAAVLVFFVFVVVKFVISIAADNGSNVIKCAECFIDNNCR